MARNSATTAAIRFGYGLSPNIAPPSGPAELLQGLRGADVVARQLPILSFSERVEKEVALVTLKKAKRRNEAGAEAAFKKARRVAQNEYGRELVTSVLRPVLSPTGFRERLVRFWADHFTIVAKGAGLRTTATAYIEEAIRPNISGSFTDLLRAAATHPVMLVYLDQVRSLGPNSAMGKKRGKGLNENLAREILELHTLGVSGIYNQDDVRQFAELLTGLHFSAKTGFKFRPAMAEPGAETVLGRAYGGDQPARLEDIYQVLEDLALHPDTAAHLSRKLVVHFVSDQPDAALVAHVTNAYRSSGGDLMAVYEALLEHPLAWQQDSQKAKQPFDYIASAIRAMAVPKKVMLGLDRKNIRLHLLSPMLIMGQPYQQASGPDGWPEGMEDWITPQGLAARIQWAMIATGSFGSEMDPQDFARIALAERASKTLLRAVGAAESRGEGRALVLASPQFNRR